MDKKKNKKSKQEAPKADKEAPRQGSPRPGSGSASGQSTDESVDWEGVAKRALADLDNYKKQQEKFRGEMTQFMSLTLMHKFLGVYDDLARVLETVKDTKIDLDKIPEEVANCQKSVMEGIENILKKFGDVFKAEGLEQINVQPKDKFDPATMEAISHEEHKDIKDDHVIEQFEGGLKYKDKVIKPAKVRVAK